MSYHPYDWTQDQKLKANNLGVGVKRAFMAHLEYADPIAADTDAILEAVTDTGEEVEIETFDGQPDYTRCITATAGGTAADIGAIQVVIDGTNELGEEITETLPVFTVNTAGTVTGSKAFKTITKVTIPAHDGTAATTKIGVSDKLGIPLKLSLKTVQSAYLDGTIEGTAPTITIDADDVENNTVLLNSSLDGNAVDVYLMVN